MSPFVILYQGHSFGRDSGHGPFNDVIAEAWANALCPCTRLSQFGGPSGQALGQVEDSVLLPGVLGEGFSDDLSKQTRVV